MARNLDVFLEARGILYDSYSSWSSLNEGGALKTIDGYANLITAATSIASLKGWGGLHLGVVAFEANLVKLTMGLAELNSELSKPNPDEWVVAEILLGVASSSAGIISSIPGVPPNVKLTANLIALGADGTKEGIKHLPGLFNELDSKIKEAGSEDWPTDPMGSGAEAIINARDQLQTNQWATGELENEITRFLNRAEAAKVDTPTDAPTRNSSAYITDTYANDNVLRLKAGGTVWDAFVYQKGSANGFSNWEEFKAAVAATNPDISDLNKVPAGAALQMPEKMPDGATLYHFKGGTTINSNPITGEYHMVVQNPDGGQTVYSRVADEFGYTVKQVSTDAAGRETMNYTGYQETRDQEVKPIGAAWQSETETGRSDWNAGDGSAITTTYYPNGVELIQAFSATGQQTGKITESPDGNGGSYRVIETMVNGRKVVVTQHALDADEGNYQSTGITIDGQPVANKEAVLGAWDEAFGSGLEMITNGQGIGDGANQSAQLEALTNAGDGTVKNGYTPKPAPTDRPWYETPEAQRFGSTLTQAQSLIAANDEQMRKAG
jgi:hypothetical protein